MFFRKQKIKYIANRAKVRGSKSDRNTGTLNLTSCVALIEGKVAIMPASQDYNFVGVLGIISGVALMTRISRL